MRVLACLVGLLLLPLALAALILGSPSSLSPSGWLTALSLLGLSAGMLSAPLRKARRRGLTRASALLLLAVFLVRTGTARQGKTVRIVAGDDPHGRLIDRLIEERDLALPAARALAWTRLFPPSETSGLESSMRRRYDLLGQEEGSVPSPVLGTYLGVGHGEDFDMLVIEDLATRGSDTTVVFLHGYAGSFTLPCYEVARAARRAGASTVCPSTRWQGDFWSPDGERRVREVATRLRGAGKSRLVLAGLSNGGIGASRLLPRMPGLFEGAILISGADAGAPPPGIPALVIHGERDTMTSASAARAYASHSRGQYVSLKGNHFAWLEEADRIESIVAAFLARLWPPPSGSASRALLTRGAIPRRGITAPPGGTSATAPTRR